MLTEYDIQHAHLEALAVDAWAERWQLNLAEDLNRRIARGKAYQAALRQHGANTPASLRNEDDSTIGAAD